MTEPLSEIVSLRLSASELEQVRWAADARGISVSAFMRLAVSAKAAEAVVSLPHLPQPLRATGAIWPSSAFTGTLSSLPLEPRHRRFLGRRRSA